MTALDPAQAPENNETIIRELIEQFRSSPMNVRLELSRRIVAFGAEAVEPLVDGLAHDNWAVRQDSANALGVLRPPAAVAALAPLLDDPEPGVRWEAARALGLIGTDAARAALTAAYQTTDDHAFRLHVHEVLAGRA